MSAAAIALVGVSALGSMQQAQAAGQAADFNSAAAREQGKLVDISTAQQKEKLRKEGGRFLESVKAAALKSGVTLDGSPSDALAESVASLKRDELNLELQAEQQKQALETGAQLGQMQAASQQAALPLNIGRDILFGMTIAG